VGGLFHWTESSPVDWLPLIDRASLLIAVAENIIGGEPDNRWLPFAPANSIDAFWHTNKNPSRSARGMSWLGFDRSESFERAWCQRGAAPR
jgi:hypothetical protein